MVNVFFGFRIFSVNTEAMIYNFTHGLSAAARLVALLINSHS